MSRRLAGQVGYIIAGMKDVKEAQIGDTLYLQDQPVEALPGFKPAKPMVFAGRNLPSSSVARSSHIKPYSNGIRGASVVVA